MMIVSIGLVTPGWQAGQLKVLGFGSEKRITQYPDVPTIAETLPGYEAASWYGLVAPAGTPREIVARLSAETQKIFAEPAFRETFLAPSMIFSIAGPPEDFASRIKTEYAKWGKVIKEAGVKVE
jgi:tripartite-type tricarboxylate transporter receptor subunit TctC